MTRTDRVLGIVQAGGQGSRLDVLTRERSKPTLPFAGNYQLIDFAMSSLAHSKIPDVWVDVQFLASTLHEHLAGGRPWDLDQTYGGFRVVLPEEGAGTLESGFSTGNADSLYKAWRQIEAFDPEIVIVMSADHIFRMDLRDAIDQHRESGAECTIVSYELSPSEAAHKAVLEVNADGRVTGVEYKPDKASSTTVSTEVTLYSTAALGRALQELRAARSEAASETEEERDTGLGDFGEYLLPWFVERGHTYAFPMPGYWRDVGRPESYLGAHRDLIAGRIDVFSDPDHPIRTRREQRVPARFGDGVAVTDSLISEGCVIRGEVRRSVLSPGVVVEAGALVEDSVIMSDTVIRAGAQVHTSIVDERCEIGRGAVVGAPPAGTRPQPDDICLVGRESRISGGARMAAGARLEPGTEA